MGPIANQISPRLSAHMSYIIGCLTRIWRILETILYIRVTLHTLMKAFRFILV